MKHEIIRNPPRRSRPRSDNYRNTWRGALCRRWAELWQRAEDIALAYELNQLQAEGRRSWGGTPMTATVDRIRAAIRAELAAEARAAGATDPAGAAWRAEEALSFELRELLEQLVTDVRLRAGRSRARAAGSATLTAQTRPVA
jgi:hypothetical protein